MTALQAAMAHKFEHRVLASVGEKFPKRLSELGREKALQRIRTGIRKAQSLGIKSEEDVIDYVHLIFELGDNFESNPQYSWMGTLLQDPEIPVDARMGLLIARLEVERSRNENGRPS